jgi:hypothetical protein
MNLPELVVICALSVQAAAAKSPSSFHWDWQNSQSLRPTQSLRNARMSEGERAAIAAALETRIRPDMADYGIESGSQLKADVMSTRIAMVDLNSDETPEVVAQARVACGASGNCPFWIFQKNSGDYKLMLEDSAETFTIQKTRTNGYSDIVLGLHDSLFEQSLEPYHFAGGEYKDAGCYSATVAVTEDDGVHKLAEPRVTPCTKQ